MGCTSSAPASLPPTPRANATDTDIEEEINVLQSKRQTVATIELPECDTDTVMKQVEVAMVASNNNEPSMKIESPLSDPTGETKNGSAVIRGKQDKLIEINHDDIKDGLTVKSDEKMTNMEDVVEKVVELYIADSNTVTASINTDKHTDTIAMPDNGNLMAEIADFNTYEETQLEGNEEEKLALLESPSQSQSSRATRWEALADVAAELPSSLTVDPLTGQIYAVSK